MVAPHRTKNSEAVRARRISHDSEIRPDIMDILDRELGGLWLIEYTDGTFLEIDGFRAPELGLQHLLDQAVANARVA